METVRFVSRETACPGDFPVGRRQNEVQARSLLSKTGLSATPNLAFGLISSFPEYTKGANPPLCGCVILKTP